MCPGELSGVIYPYAEQSLRWPSFGLERVFLPCHRLEVGADVQRPCGLSRERGGTKVGRLATANFYQILPMFSVTIFEKNPIESIA